MLHTLKLPLDQLDPFLDARLLPEEVRHVLEVIERRAADRVPAAYITHEAWLGSYRFYVDERVIVPRSFIAELVPEQFAPWVSDPDAVEQRAGAVHRLRLPGHHAGRRVPEPPMVDAVDISADALAVAQRNVADYQLEDRIDADRSPTCTTHCSRTKSYDLIVTNPPYVNAGLDGQAAARIPARAADRAGRRRRRHGPGAQDRRRRAPSG